MQFYDYKCWEFRFFVRSLLGVELEHLILNKSLLFVIKGVRVPNLGFALLGLQAGQYCLSFRLSLMYRSQTIVVDTFGLGKIMLEACTPHIPRQFYI